MTKNKVKLRLQGHEKFALREGWINKGLMLIPKDSSIFSKQDAPDVFGIGNNMVKSLRYWMRAFGLIIEGGSAGVSLSPMGKLKIRIRYGSCILILQKIKKKQQHGICILIVVMQMI